MLEYLGDAMILAFGAFSAFLLFRLLKYRSLKLVEPRLKILIPEIICAIAIVGLALERLIDDLL